MSLQNVWIALLATGLALTGVWGAWVPHRAAALVLSGWDLAEFAKFVPGVSATRELFFLPVWCAGLVLGLVSNQRKQSQWMGLLAVGLMVTILPPYPHFLNGYRSPEFRWQFILGASGLLVILASFFSPPWPVRIAGGGLVVLALTGTFPVLWQFVRLRGAIEVVYGARLGWGWGLVPFIAGWAVVGIIGGWSLLEREEVSHN